MLLAAPQPAAAQEDLCAPYANNAPYYERCQQIHQQSARIRAEQARQAQQAADKREERLDSFYDPEKQKTPAKTRSKKDARAAAYEKIAPTPVKTTTTTATIPVQQAPTAAAPGQPTYPDEVGTASGPAPAIAGAGYIVIDPAKLSVEQLQTILQILKDSSLPASITPSAAAPVVQPAPVTPQVLTDAPAPFSQQYPVITGRQGATAVTLPDIGQGGQEVMEIEPVDPASLRLQP